MPFPNTSLFEQFLRALTITSPGDSSDFLTEIAIPETIAKDAERAFTEKQFPLYFRPVGDFTLDSLVGRVQRELELVGHKTNRDIAMVLLCIYCLHPRRQESPVSSLNEIILHITDADLSQFFVLPAQPPSGFHNFSFGSFTIGALNSERVSYRSRKAQSDFFEKWGSRLTGRMSIERSVVQVKAFDLKWIRDTYGDSIFSNHSTFAVWDRFTEAYFHFMSKSFGEDFWSAFMEEQELQVAAGAPYLREREVRLFPGTSHVSIYLNIGQTWGFVAPIGTAFLQMDLGKMDEKIPEVITRLHNEFNFNNFTQSELHQTIKTYARFISIAKGHIIEKRMAEGFLHFIIALDLLFGDKDALNKMITRRVAVITHRKLNLSFDDATKIVSKAYDARSKYVHQGSIQGMANIDQVQRLAEEVLFCLLRLQRDSTNGGIGFIDRWRKHLDFFVSSLESGRTIPESELVANGIVPR